MKVCFISDTHCLHRRVAIPWCDLIVFSGDFSDIGEFDVLEDFNDWVAWRGVPFVAIAGNHDVTLEKNPGIEKDMLSNVIYLKDSMVEIEGLKIWGSPMSKRIGRWAFQYELEDGERVWERLPQEHMDIIVTHGPPKGILDKVARGWTRVGCPALGQAVEKAHPLIHAFGHIHEDNGVFQRNGIFYINSSIWDHTTNRLNKPILMEINEDREVRRILDD